MAGLDGSEQLNATRRAAVSALTRTDILALLESAEIGAFATSPDQVIVFWNQAAEQMLGFSADQVVGVRCYEAVAGMTPGSSSSECLYGCPFLRILRAGEIPGPRNMQVLSASGERTHVTMTPVIVSDPEREVPLVLHLLAPRDDAAGQADAGQYPRTELAGRPAAVVARQSAESTRSAGYQPLSARELEVLRLVSQGWSTERIAEDLEISVHTVRNHVRHFRRKLQAKTKLDAVLAGMRLGILDR